MGKVSYVCASCSQDFTRKWSGERHNKQLHFGMAEIVRVLDYIIGRLSDKYFQADPLGYRKRHKNGENKNHFGHDCSCAGTKESREGERRDPNENWNTLSESTQYDRESKGSSKNSEATKKEMLDEIKALLSIRCLSASERDIEYILNAASLQNDYWLNDYMKWLRDSTHE